MSAFNFLRPLTSEEYAALKADIADGGQKVAIVRDQHGVTIDGLNRERALTELGVPESAWKIETKIFADDRERIAYATSVNLIRRQSSAEDRRLTAIALFKAHPDWTQAEVAAVVGVAQSQISGYLATLSVSDKVAPPAPLKKPPKKLRDTLGRKRSPGRPKKGSTNKSKRPKVTDDMSRTPVTPPEPITELDESGRVGVVNVRGVSIETWNAFIQMAFEEGKFPPAKVSDLINNYVSSGTIGGIPHKVLRTKLAPIIDELEQFARQHPGTISNGSVSHTAARIRNLLKEWRETDASASATPRRAVKKTVAGVVQDVSS